MMNTNGPHDHERLSAYLDDEIDSSERDAVESHLAECGSCRELVNDLRTLDAAIAAEPVPAVPVGLASRIGWRLRSAGSRQASG